MRIGIAAARFCTLDRRAAVRAAASAAESLGYSSFWTSATDLALVPAAAAVTRRIGLGAGPVGSQAAHARALAALANADAGRVTVALGSPVASQAAAAALRSGNVGRVLVTSNTAPVDLVVCRADGWMSSGLATEDLAGAWARVREVAARHGQDPEKLRMVVRAGVALANRARNGSRPTYHGDVDQVAADIATTVDAGADEVVLDIDSEVCLDQALDVYARIAEAVSLRTGAPAA